MTISSVRASLSLGACVLTGAVAPTGALANAGAAEIAACRPAAPLRMIVQIGNGTHSVPRAALLIGGTLPPLRVVDALTAQELWSAGAAPPATQQFPAMTAAFSGSLTAIDTNGDGLQDRIYAGDLAGRIWRFDLHQGAPASRWAAGGVFADFADAVNGRAFVAPPDVSLSSAATGRPWLNIAVGSASLREGAANNRFYVLRDHAVSEAWSMAAYARWRPLRESDLALLDSARSGAPADNPLPDASHGYFFSLGTGQILTPSITVAGRTVLAIAEASPTTASQCRVPVSVSAVTADSGAPVLDADRDGHIGRDDWRLTLPTAIRADAAFTIAKAAPDDTSAICMLGDTYVAACNADSTPTRTFWRREDAD